MTKAFATLPLSTPLIQVLQELGYQAMTPIQEQAIPALLKGRDLIGQSKTGSGKTAAFSLPILQKIRIRERTVQALVLCPTRELCTQVAREMRKLGRRHAGLQVLILSGGQPFGPQAAALEKGAHIAVGTPGRVLDHLGRGTLELDRAMHVVLDEADRMLDMGFQADMEDILGSMPTTRQTVFFSATFPESIEGMSAAYQKNPLRVSIADENQEKPSIRQLIVETTPDDKREVLCKLIGEQAPESAIVFCNHKATVSELAIELESKGISASCLHGDMEQRDRDREMAKFRNRSICVLVATDVAARGIDIADLDVVFNFDLPAKPETYVHRIGRTGRAGKAGLAISLLTAKERRKLEMIETTLERTLEPYRFEARPAIVVDKQLHASMVTIFIAGGRKQKLRPGDILGALTGEAGGLQAKDIGKIEIHDNFAYVAVAKSVASVALRSLQDGKIKGRKFRVELVN